MRLIICVILAIATFTPLAWAQSECEAGVTRRLATALGVRPADMPGVSRDYTGLFPGVVFYRSAVADGFHTGHRRAALAVIGSDSIVVRGVADAPVLWERLVAGRNLRIELMVQSVYEMLFQASILDRGDRILNSAAELSRAYRIFLAPGGWLDSIRSPVHSLSDDGMTMVFYVQSTDGIARYFTTVSGSRLRIERELVTPQVH